MFCFTYDVLNDQNVKSDFNRFLTFVILIFDVLVFLTFDVLISLKKTKKDQKRPKKTKKDFRCSDALINF
jgi:hypothetical protein